MINSLYPHNKQAYEAVKAHYADGHRKACVVHATGTGKSYIIGALTDGYKRVLIVAPNDYVLEQVRQHIGHRASYATYTKLMFDAKAGKTPINRYDLIVLDEYHRAGAELWGEGIQTVIAANPTALLFGTTATDIRYLDNRRNMSKELFDGHIVSTITIGEAWARGILRAPVYVCALESFEDTALSYQGRIDTSKAGEEEKQRLANSLYAARKDWENVGGVPAILRKHLPDDVKRIIVFCTDIHSASRYQKTIQDWFAQSGIRIDRIYTIDSGKTPAVNLKEMERFQEEGGAGVKIMISVNMLNEGIHVPRVDAVIMLRGTASGNIYLQQMGRCMQAGKDDRRPVVFDLANNISSAFTTAATSFAKNDYEQAVKQLKEENKDAEPGDYIKVVDYLMNTREILSKLDEHMAYLDRWAVWDNHYAIAKEFYETHGHFPANEENTQIRMWARSWFWRYAEDYPERAGMLRRIGYDGIHHAGIEWEENYSLAKEHFNKTGHFPTRKENPKLRTWASNYMRKHKGEDPEKDRLLYDIGYAKNKTLWQKRYQTAKDYYDKHGHFPSGRQWEYLQKYFVNHTRRSNNKEEEELLRAVGWGVTKEMWRTKIDELKAFYKQHGRLPTETENELLRGYIRSFVKTKGERHPEVMAELSAMGWKNKNIVIKPWEDRYKEAKSIFEETGKFPNSKHPSKLWQWAHGWVKRSKGNDPERMQLLLNIGFKPTKEKKK